MRTETTLEYYADKFEGVYGVEVTRLYRDEETIDTTYRVKEVLKDPKHESIRELFDFDLIDKDMENFGMQRLDQNMARSLYGKRTKGA